MCYLTQSYFLVPSIIRKQANWMIIRKLSGTKDKRAIIKESGCGLENQELTELYEYCTEGENTNFLLIKMDGNKSNRFRKNFDEKIVME